MKTKIKNSIPLLLVPVLLFACKQKVSQEELIEAAVTIKLAQWREEHIKTCKEDALVEAEEYVDSILVVLSLGSKLDTIPKPDKPNKPLKPSFKTKPDSVVVDPIYKKRE